MILFLTKKMESTKISKKKWLHTENNMVIRTRKGNIKMVKLKEDELFTPHLQGLFNKAEIVIPSSLTNVDWVL